MWRVVNWEAEVLGSSPIAATEQADATQPYVLYILCKMKR